MSMDLRGGHSKDNPCMTTHCYSVAYETKKVCIDDHSVDNGTFIAKDRTYQPLSMALKGRKNLSIFLKLDIEGSEWATLERLLANEEHMAKIRTIDMEVHIHWDTTPKGHGYMSPETLTHNVELMEKLAEKFMVTGSDIERYMKTMYKHYRQLRKKDSSFMDRYFRDVYLEGGIDFVQYCVSFVNRKVFESQ